MCTNCRQFVFIASVIVQHLQCIPEFNVSGYICYVSAQITEIRKENEQDEKSRKKTASNAHSTQQPRKKNEDAYPEEDL